VSSTALALVLVAALLHATWNLAIKGVTADRVTFIWLYVVTTVVFWVPVAVIWVVASGESPAWVWLLGAAVTGVLHVAYQLVLQRGYAEGDLNLVYPLARGSGPLITFLVAVTVLGQRPGIVAGLGVLAIVTGVLMIAIGPTHDGVRAGVVFGLLTGAAIAAYTLWDNFSVNHLEVPPVPYFVLGTVLQLPWLTGLLATRRSPVPIGEVWRATRGPALVVGLLSPLAYILVLRALQLAPVALVAPARESAIVVGALFGWLVLHEPRPARRLVGAVVVLAGIVLIAVG
jgi:drug/metabolite transporter (DMT)-like permease